MKAWIENNWKKLLGGVGIIAIMTVGFAITWYVGIFTVIAGLLGGLLGSEIAKLVNK